LCAPCDRSGRSAWLEVAPLIDSRLDTAKICSDGRVHVDHAQLPAVFGGEKNVFTRPGSKAELTARESDFRFTPESGLKSEHHAMSVCADIVAKVFLGWRTKILRAADAFYARRREGPYRFHPNRSRTSVVAFEKRRSGREVQRSTFARFSGSLDFRLLQQYLPRADIAPVSVDRKK